jgi:hypothetical protein
MAITWNTLQTINDPLKRRLAFVGVLTKELRKYQVVPILVGGNALEFYTFGGYSTQDIDIVCADPEKVDLILSQQGFRKEGRHWVHEDLLLAVEIPATQLSGSTGRLERVELENLEIMLISKEDLLIDRLNACVHWESPDDCRWVLELLFLYETTVDWEYLTARAAENDVQNKLGELKDQLATMRESEQTGSSSR